MSPGFRPQHSCVLAGGRDRLVADALSVLRLSAAAARGNEGSRGRTAPLVTFYCYLLLFKF